MDNLIGTVFGAREANVRELLHDLEQNLPSPLAKTVNDILAARSEDDLLSAITEHYKLTNQFVFLVMLCLVKDIGCGVPHDVQTLIRRKWLRGARRDLTEGERTTCTLDLKLHVEVKRLTSKTTAVKRALEAVPTDGEDRSLSILKRDVSHRQRGGATAIVERLSAIADDLEMWFERIRRLCLLDLLIVEPSGRATHLLGMGRGRSVPHTFHGATVVLREREGNSMVRLDPLFKPAQDDAIQMFLWKGEGKSAVHVSLTPDAREVPGDTEVIPWLTSLLDARSEKTKLVGLEDAEKSMVAQLTSWIDGRKSRPILVLGEEGTGKSELIRQVLNSPNFKDRLFGIAVSGSSYESDPDRFYIQVLSQLFGIDSNRDGEIVDRLAQFCTEQNVVGAKRLVVYLRHRDLNGAEVNESELGRIFSQGSTQRRSMEPSSVTEEHSAPSIAQRYRGGRADTYFPELWQVLSVAADSEDFERVVLWVEDAQRFERADQAALKTLLQIANDRGERVTLIAEFRAERSRDVTRIKETYQHSLCGPAIYADHLKKHQVNLLIGAILGVSPDAVPKVFSERIYSQTGGNPKLVKDFLGYLVALKLVERGMDPESLASAAIQDIPIPQDIQQLYRERLAQLGIQAAHLEVLSLLSLSADQDVPVNLIRGVVGEGADAIVTDLLDDVEILNEGEQDDQWLVRFEHLAAKDACREMTKGQTAEFLAALKDKAMAAYRNEGATDTESTASLRQIARELCTLSKDPNGLAELVAGRVLLSEKRDLDKLKEWQGILRRTVKHTPCSQVVQPYLRLKIKVLEDGVGAIDPADFLFIRRVTPILVSASSESLSALAGIAGSCLAMSMVNEDSKIVEAGNDVWALVSALYESDHSAKAKEQSIGVLAIQYWSSIPPSFQCRGKLYTAFRAAGKAYAVGRREQVLFRALCGIFSDFEMDSAFQFNSKDLEDDLALVRPILLSEEKSPATWLGLGRDARNDAISLIRSHLLGIQRDATPPLDVDRSFEQLRDYRVGLSGRALEEITDILSDLAGWRADLVARVSGGRSAIDGLLQLCREFPDRLQAPLLATALLIAREECIAEPDLLARFEALLNRMRHEDLLVGAEIEDILSAASAYSIANVAEVIRDVLGLWIGGAVRGGLGLGKVCGTFGMVRAVFKLDVGWAFGKLKAERAWVAPDTVFIRLQELICAWDHQDGETSTIGRRERDKRFGILRDLYLEEVMPLPKSPQRKAVTVNILRAMHELLEDCRISNKDERELLKNFRRLLEHIAPESRSVDGSESYWQMRWATLRQAGESASALEEFNELYRLEVEPSAKAFLLHQASRLAFDVEEHKSPARDRSRSGPTADAASRAFQYALAWHELFPKSGKCIRRCLNLGDYLPIPEQRQVIALAEEYAVWCESRREFETAFAMYESLLGQYYSLGDRLSARASGEKALQFTNGVWTIEEDRRNDLANNTLYVSLSCALADGGSIAPLIQQWIALLKQTKSPLLPRYNLALAYAIGGQCDLALANLKEVLSASDKDRDIATSWLQLYVEPLRALETNGARLSFAARLSGARIHLVRGDMSQGAMWLNGVFGRMVEQRQELELVQLVLDTATAFHMRPPSSYLAHAKVSHPALIERIEAVASRSEYALSKTDMCPCRSGKSYRECCRPLFTP